jgi:hypothetical protein
MAEKPKEFISAGGEIYPGKRTGIDEHHRAPDNLKDE